MFWACTRLALQGFGGVIAIAQRELVERLGWLTQQEFVELLAVAQVLPGPNIVNLAMMIGDRFFGWRGAAAALGGMLAIPSVVVLSLAALVGHGLQHGDNAWLAGALRGMGLVAAGLVLATGLKLLPTLRRHPLGWGYALALGAWVLPATLLWHVPLVLVLLGLGGLGMALTWRALATTGEPPP
ncbi:chromate transporter [Roseateles sp. BYS180W]|uniref:Chromate transporter n=1 Tax=Roseateles rivi TaxID=3299028 RepID=A0ABW7FZL0_9BURK